MIRAGHPWVFASGIREQNRGGNSGELAVIYDRRDRFLAVGLFDPDSPLRVRILQSGRPATIDDAWWQARLDGALEKRQGILDAHTTACRLINGESDGWPGLVLDRYEDVLVLKLYTGAWAVRLNEVVQLFASELAPGSVVFRSSRNVQPFFETSGWRDGRVIFGAPIIGPITFLESGIHFEADVLSGQKTGFFLDQRENRRAVGNLARGADVLNAFSFSGGFSLYAARGGARSVTDLDISAHALASARRNFELNRSDSTIARCRHETIQANAFDWLEENHARQFDLIVLDPPSLAKRESERAGALRAYEKLVRGALRYLRPRSHLVAASCSAHVTAAEFFAAVRGAVAGSRRRFTELQTTGHATDHPASFAEAQYLKCIFLRLEH